MSFQAAERPTPASTYEIKVEKRNRRSKFVVKIGVSHTLAAEPKVGRGSYHVAISENVKETSVPVDVLVCQHEGRRDTSTRGIGDHRHRPCPFFSLSSQSPPPSTRRIPDRTNFVLDHRTQVSFQKLHASGISSLGRVYREGERAVKRNLKFIHSPTQNLWIVSDNCVR